MEETDPLKGSVEKDRARPAGLTRKRIGTELRREICRDDTHMARS